MESRFLNDRRATHKGFAEGYKNTLLLIAMAILSDPAMAYAEEVIDNSLWEKASNVLSQTWQSPDYELYIPVNTWHNRSAYSDEKIDSFNERPWGLGAGKYRYDEDGDWHALYAMAFMDSNNDLQPVAGYGFEKIWRPADDVRLGVGYAVGLTARQNIHYLPIPGILPLVSVEYKSIAVQSTYVPGGNGYGNILFTWLRWQM